MASSNQRRRQVARAKYERQQLRRSTREQRRRRRRRAALVVAIVAVLGLIVLGVYVLFFADAATTPTAAHATFTGRAPTPSPDPGSIR